MDLFTCADHAPAITIVRANKRAGDLLNTVAYAGRRTGDLLFDGAALLELHGCNVNTKRKRQQIEQHKMLAQRLSVITHAVITLKPLTLSCR